MSVDEMVKRQEVPRLLWILRKKAPAEVTLIIPCLADTSLHLSYEEDTFLMIQAAYEFARNEH